MRSDLCKIGQSVINKCELASKTDSQLQSVENCRTRRGNSGSVYYGYRVIVLTYYTTNQCQNISITDFHKLISTECNASICGGYQSGRFQEMACPIIIMANTVEYRKSNTLPITIGTGVSNRIDENANQINLCFITFQYHIL